MCSELPGDKRTALLLSAGTHDLQVRSVSCTSVYTSSVAALQLPYFLLESPSFFCPSSQKVLMVTTVVFVNCSSYEQPSTESAYHSQYVY